MKQSQIFVQEDFWISGQRAFLDVRVFDPNASRYTKQALSQSYALNEKEKKRNCNERTLDVDNGSFTPLVFSLYGGMGRECRTFIKDYQSCLQRKERHLPIHITSSWLNTKINFSLVKSCLLCLRGSRQVFPLRENTCDDIMLNHAISQINRRFHTKMT